MDKLESQASISVEEGKVSVTEPSDRSPLPITLCDNSQNNDIPIFDEEFLSLLLNINEDIETDITSVSNSKDSVEQKIQKIEKSVLTVSDTKLDLDNTETELIERNTLFDNAKEQQQQAKEEDLDLSFLGADFTNLTVQGNNTHQKCVSPHDKESNPEILAQSKNNVDVLVDKLLNLALPSSDFLTSDTGTSGATICNSTGPEIIQYIDDFFFDSNLDSLEEINAIDEKIEDITLDTKTANFKMSAQDLGPHVATAYNFIPKPAQPYVLSMKSKGKRTDPSNERSCFGHKETIFDLSFSPCGKYLATAGQDSKIMIWKTKDNSLLTTLLGHDVLFECLRVTW